MRRVLALIVLSGCAPSSGEPFWALDPIWIEPVGGGIHGVQAWELFAEEWGRRFASRHYVCGIVVEIDGVPASPCTHCDDAWAIETQVSDSDCAPEIADDPRFLALEALGIGADLPDVAGDVPHPGEASGVWADYGYGWDVYGWGYPEALDQGQAVDDPTWEGGEPFALAPAFVWEVAASPPGAP